MYHIGVGLNVVRFDKMGLPEPQLVGRATGRFTLFYCCSNKLIVQQLKVKVMVRPKLSFDKKEDRATAIADFIRENVSSIKFVSEMRGKEVLSATNVFVTNISEMGDDSTHWNVSGRMFLKYVGNEEGMILDQQFRFTCSCKVERGKDDVPVVSDLKTIMVSKI